MKWFFFAAILLIQDLSIANDVEWKNCIGNQFCRPIGYSEPTTLNELQAVVKKASDHGYNIRIAGGGYSISNLVCTSGYLISLKQFDHILSVDVENSLVHVETGITVRELNEKLAEYGLALSNQAAIDDISLGGAIATGAHGTGHTGTLSSFVKEIDLLTADGIIHHLSATSEPEIFEASKVSLGSLGVIYAVKLQCEPLFYLKVDHEVCDIDALVQQYGELTKNNDHFQFGWNVDTGKVVTTRWNRSPQTDDAKICYKALACYTIDENDKDLFSEIAVPLESFEVALTKIKSFQEEYKAKGIKIAHVVVRFVEAEEKSLLSPAADQAVAYMTMSIPADCDATGFYEHFEEMMLTLQGRPHWGKTNFVDGAKAKALYGDKFEKFIRLRKQLDPKGIFSNGYIQGLFGEGI